jgi:Flp pilus assembly protein TadG
MIRFISQMRTLSNQFRAAAGSSFELQAGARQSDRISGGKIHGGRYAHQRRGAHPRDQRRRGVGLILVIMILGALLGICSLAVDYGRAVVVKTELRRAADAAARAAVANLSAGNTAAINAAVAELSSNQNLADGQPVVLVTGSDIQFINWTSSSSYSVVANASQANAVRVYCRRVASRGTAVNLFFANIIGVPSVDVTAFSTAYLNTQTTTQFVSTYSNPWLAGEPLGTQGSQHDPGWDGQDVNKEHPWEFDIAGPNGGSNSAGEPYESPVQMSITVQPGANITVTNVSGTGGNDWTAGAVATADGNQSGTYYNYDDAASDGVSEHGMADSTMPLNSLNAVFLTNNLPDNQTVPPTTDFSTQSERDYTTYAPQLQQVFYVGTGTTSTGAQQSFTVPTGATQLYLGTMDGWEWSNNIGGYTATITQTYIQLVQ